MTIATRNPPEQGQLVTVRQRQYVVSEVAKSTLPAARQQLAIRGPFLLIDKDLRGLLAEEKSLILTGE